MNKKLYQIGLTLCGLCLSFFTGIFSHYVCMTFFGEPEFPNEK